MMIYYVAWQGYTADDCINPNEPLDTLCLHGPHTKENAHKVAKEIRAEGKMATVINLTSGSTALNKIDCAMDWVERAKRYGSDMLTSNHSCLNDALNCLRDARSALMPRSN